MIGQPDNLLVREVVSQAVSVYEDEVEILAFALIGEFEGIGSH